MELSPTSRRIVRFGVFEVDFAAAQLRKRGRRVKLEAQPFQVLSILLQRPGELVTRDELRNELWPADTFVEFDHSLNTAVKKIRQALGDSPRQPRYIETVPRQGYRFIAAVDVGVGHARSLQHDRPAWMRLAGAAAVAVAVIGIGVGWFLGRNGLDEARPLKAVPLTSYPGFEVQPSFSPDGDRVVFWRDGGLWVKSVAGVAGEQPVQLTTDPAEGADPAWSPDGSSIAFLREIGPERAAVFRISPLGGRASKLTEIDAGEQWASPRIAWSPDSKRLVISDKPSASEPFALFLYTLETGEKRRLTAPDGTIFGDSQAAFSPEGRTLAFNRLTISDPVGERHLLTLRLTRDLVPQGEPRQLPLDHDRISNPVWSEDGRDIIYAAEGRLWRVAASGKRAPRPILSSEVRHFLPIAINHRSRRLAYGSSNGDHNIWRVALSDAGDKGARFIHSTSNDYTPKYSPDGARIAFASNRSGSGQIWVCDQDGSDPVQLTFLKEGVTDSPAWSPDGKTIAFYSMATGTANVYVVNAEGGHTRQLKTGPEGGSSPSYSRDGRWIYFDSNRGGEREVWKMPAEGGDAVPVTKNGGTAAREGPDGRYLYYTKDGGLWRMPVGGGEESQVLDSVVSGNFAVVENGVYFVPGEKHAPGLPILFRSFETGQTSEVARIEDLPGWRLDVSPDRRYLLYTTLENLDFDLMLVEDFR